MARRNVGGVPYEPHLIYEFCGRLYAAATTAILLRTAIGVATGALAGFPLTAIVGRVNPAAVVTPEQTLATGAICTACGVAIFGLMGFLVGREKAFWIKLEAQRTLCQLKIEENTRNLGRE